MHEFVSEVDERTNTFQSSDNNTLLAVKYELERNKNDYMNLNNIKEKDNTRVQLEKIESLDLEDV